ncbi:hypothetical protein IPJ70_00040 [Candidatus Campbellbacteria bacterium]|nr:MAG: hypothetical protein IPJ70_00040 [Candidatus Campbellbacteria bacterium]
MFTFLRKIQQRPEQERRTIALWTAFWITAGIFGIWLISFFAHLNQLSSVSDTAILEKVSPLNSSKETLLLLWNSIKGVLQN